jgi:hypothetical protein
MHAEWSNTFLEKNFLFVQKIPSQSIPLQLAPEALQGRVKDVWDEVGRGYHSAQQRLYQAAA